LSTKANPTNFSIQELQSKDWPQCANEGRGENSSPQRKIGHRRAVVDEKMSLTLLNRDAGELRWRRLAKNCGGGQTLGRVAAARVRGSLRGGEAWPAGCKLRWTAEGAERSRGARTRRNAGGEQDGGVRARLRQQGLKIRVRNETATNHYDRRDPCFSVASDEATTRKKRRSNRQIGSTPGRNQP
jgi:hypothetical protein